jgi:hypothetical protein
VGRGIMIDRMDRYKEWERNNGERRNKIKVQEDKEREERNDFSCHLC